MSFKIAPNSCMPNGSCVALNGLAEDENVLHSIDYLRNASNVEGIFGN